MDFSTAGRSDFRPYHDRTEGTVTSRARRQAAQQETRKLNRVARKVLEQDKKFVAWDGEGINILGSNRPQAYVLFGNSADGSIENTDTGLSTWECLDFIVRTGERHPNAIHVGFAFGYDSNMIVQSLAPVTLANLHRKGYVRLKHNLAEYVITYRKSKWFQVTRTLLGSRVTLRIYDIFTFFMSSFEDAYTKMIGPISEIITKGKAGRKSFTLAEFGTVKEYWTLEIQLVRELAEELRSRVYGAGIYITEWHGPGALATYVMRERGVRDHMRVCPDAVRLAARYAYAAGRFEAFHVGRTMGPVWGIDLNSAYPAALRLVPSLSEGTWEHEDWSVRRAGQIIRDFGLYYCKLRGPVFGAKKPSPLYHRDKHHELTFPWHTEGWYWGPEAKHAAKAGAIVTEAWQYTGWTTRPFAFINDTFELRRAWKLVGNSAEMSLKLAMNAMTGKAAQRVGWKENGRIPGWHQLEWAGFVTSYTRAAMYSVMSQVPYEDLIAIETDGFYTTCDPARLGISKSTELGGWSIDEYDEVMYVQSGLAWLRHGNEWTPKRRGLDKESFELEHCRDYLSTLKPNERWPVFSGVTTRFATMGLALASRNVKARHCVWTTTTREISVGRQGKRIHVAKFCAGCQSNSDAYTAPHDLIVAPPGLKDRSIKSYPHSIPWESEIGHADYRDRMAEEDLYVSG